MKLCLICEDEFSDLDDNDVFGVSGYPVDSGDWRYSGITLKTSSNTYTGCKARVSYIPSPLRDPDAWKSGIEIIDPYVMTFIIPPVSDKLKIWNLNQDGTVKTYYNGGIWLNWQEFDGGLSEEDIKSITSQILDLFESELDNIIEYENEYYYGDGETNLGREFEL